VALLRANAWLTCLWLAVALLATGGARAIAGPPSEYQVKAVFLFNFTQFVDWPPQAFPGPDAPFVIGVLGQDPFGPQLDEVVRGETVNRRPLVIERYRSVAEIRDCNILFIGSTESGHLDEILAALKGRSILTVGDADPGGQRGVMIRLVNENSRIRLRIDVAAAKAGNLTISSKLLRPAEIVGPGAGD
jgi:YfiR/HmsC-like